MFNLFQKNCGLENYFEKAFNNHILSSVSEKHINLLSWTCLNAHPLGNLLAFIKTYHLSIHILPLFDDDKQKEEDTYI